MITNLSLRLESFKIQFLDIANVDLAELHALSMSVRWPHRSDDWKMLLGLGHGIAAVDDIGRVIGSAMWFLFGDEFATIGMVITSPRLQAHGATRWAMDHVLGQIRSGTISLSATRAARRLYKSLGFAVRRPIYQCQGEVIAAPPVPPPIRASIRPLTAGDLAEVRTLDHAAIGGDRKRLLDQLFAKGQGRCSFGTIASQHLPFAGPSVAGTLWVLLSRLGRRCNRGHGATCGRSHWAFLAHRYGHGGGRFRPLRRKCRPAEV